MFFKCSFIPDSSLSICTQTLNRQEGWCVLLTHSNTRQGGGGGWDNVGLLGVLWLQNVSRTISVFFFFFPRYFFFSLYFLHILVLLLQYFSGPPHFRTERIVSRCLWKSKWTFWDLMSQPQDVCGCLSKRWQKIFLVPHLLPTQWPE